MKTIDILQSSLQNLGYNLETFLLGPNNKSFTQISHPSRKGMLTLSTNSPLYPFATASARLISNHKPIAHDFAKRRGVSLPDSVYIKSDSVYDEAYALLNTYGFVIAKPANSSVSNGVTLDIDTREKLLDAIDVARQFSDDVIVQQQVFGEEIRFAVLNGKLRAAILRQTAHVIGDGMSDLSMLIEQENHLRQQIQDTAVPYPALTGTLIDMSKFDLDSIPLVGQRVELSRGTMIKSGASMYNVIDAVHESYVEVVEDLAGALGAGFIVVDVILVDYTRAATADNYAFIEFNLTPALPLFYSCRDGKHFRVAEDYLAPMISEAIERKHS